MDVEPRVVVLLDRGPVRVQGHAQLEMRLLLKEVVRFLDLGKGPSHFQIVQPQVKRRIARLFNNFRELALTKFATRQV